MANIKFTDKQWERVHEYRIAGLSLSEISKKTGISKSRLSAALKETQTEPQTEQLINEAVRVRVAKSTLSKMALSVHEEIVDEKTHYIKYFSHAAITNVREAMAYCCESQMDFKLRAETINKGREAVLGKSPDTAIQINNQPASSAKEWLNEIVDEINK